MTLRRLRHLKSLSSFTFGEKESNLSRVYSLSRLGEASTPTTVEMQWARIWEAVCALYQDKFVSRVSRAPTFAPGQLSSLHDDIHVMLLSTAGASIFDMLQSSLLPTANQLLLANIRGNTADLVANLAAAWIHFYTHVLPAVEAVFVHVKNPRLSVRLATLLAFRDLVVLQLEPQLGPILSEMFEEQSVDPALKQMVLVLQSVSECYPPSQQRLQLETLSARIVSPYLGFNGLYAGGNVTPILASNELAVAHLRRISVVDPRRLTRPLSVNSSLHMGTLSDLFVVSARRENTAI